MTTVTRRQAQSQLDVQPHQSHFPVQPIPSRPVLKPIHTNVRHFRRLPQRMASAVLKRFTQTRSASDGGFRIPVVAEDHSCDSAGSSIGSRKRKRNENERVVAKVPLKRSKSAYGSLSRSVTVMDLDGPIRRRKEMVEPQEEEDPETEPEEEAVDSSDDFYLTSAPARQLQRLLKEDLQRLYDLAGLGEADEELTKHDLVAGLISARRSKNSQSRSRSPPSATTDGNEAAAEESDASIQEEEDGRRARKLRRSATTPSTTVTKNVKRSKSVNFDNGAGGSRRARFAQELKSPQRRVETRRQASVNSSHRSSPSSPGPSSAIDPPRTSLRRTRSRQNLPLLPDSSSSRSRKKVEFHSGPESTSATEDDADDATKDGDWEDEVGVEALPSTRGRAKLFAGVVGGNDRTPTGVKRRFFSPKKLRPRPSRMTIPGVMAKLMNKKGALKDEDEEHDEEEEDQLMEEQDQLVEDVSQSGSEEDESDDDDTGSQAEESPVPEATPRPARTLRNGTKSAVKSTKRERGKKVREETPVSQDDDAADEASDGEVEVASEDGEELVEDDEVAEPRVLRSGKVVGSQEDDEDEVLTSDDAPAEEDGDESEDIAESGSGEDDEGLIEVEEVEDDGMEEDFDLTEATRKSLARMRRDDLVRLCETRDLEAEGTKVQLVNNLLEWRDDQANAPSSSTQHSRGSSSDASTVRASSTFHGAPTRHEGSPVLLRSDRVHVTQPRTPDPDPDAQEIVLVGSKDRNRSNDNGDELELDLESLGLEDREIPAEKLTKMEKIGSGGFKDVYIGKFRGRRVAIAEFRGHLGPMDIKELKLLSDFNHPNVVRFLGVSIPENTRETPVMMISELCSNGDLFDYVRNVPPPPLRKLLNLMLDIARGLDYLHNIHKPSVIHRDCKSSNILITSKVTAKIADFGLAKVKQSTRSMVKSLVGTVNWQAPELWHAHPKYDHKVDVFSCAMVFWEMLQWHAPTKKYPWEGMNEHAIYEEVGAKKHRPAMNGLRKLWCPEIVDLVESMWRQDPKERPPIADVVDELESILANL